MANPVSLIERAVATAGAEKLYNALSEKERVALRFCWQAWGRPSQLSPPGDWLIWLLLAGRGYGKSRSGAEFIRAEVEAGRARRICLVAKTPADVRDVMVEGDAGFLHISPPWNMPVYEPTKRRLTWPNGAMALAFSSHEPDQLRGPQFDTAWADEIGAWAYPSETWDNMMLALRAGQHPRVVATTTPRPIKLIRDLLANPHAVVTRGTTYENRKNLAESFYSQVVARYEGTTRGRQEIYGELLDEAEGALWQRNLFRYQAAPNSLERIVVAIDPAATHGAESDETGIVVAGRSGQNWYVLADLSGRYSPDAWARRAIGAFEQFKADRIIGEVNNGGEMVEHTLRTVSLNVPYRAVHASQGKRVRAEPIAALYEQGKVFHAKPFPDLEDQLCTWTAESNISPDRLDALVWALTELQGAGVEAVVTQEKRSLWRD